MYVVHHVAGVLVFSPVPVNTTVIVHCPTSHQLGWPRWPEISACTVCAFAGVWGSELRSFACTAGTLPTEPAPQPDVLELSSADLFPRILLFDSIRRVMGMGGGGGVCIPHA